MPPKMIGETAPLYNVFIWIEWKEANRMFFNNVEKDKCQYIFLLLLFRLIRKCDTIKAQKACYVKNVKN